MKIRSRVNAVDEEMPGKWKECGVRQIVYGLESGSQRVLDCMEKHATVARNERAVRLTTRPEYEDGQEDRPDGGAKCSGGY